MFRIFTVVPLFLLCSACIDLPPKAEQALVTASKDLSDEEKLSRYCMKARNFATSNRIKSSKLDRLCTPEGKLTKFAEEQAKKHKGRIDSILADSGSR